MPHFPVVISKAAVVFTLLDYKTLLWKSILMFSLNCFNTTSNFILIGCKVQENKRPTGFLLCWPWNPQPKSRPLKVVPSGRGQWCLFNISMAGMNDCGWNDCASCPMSKILQCKMDRQTTAGPPDEDSWPTRWRQLAHQMKTTGPTDEDSWPTRWRQLSHQMKTTGPPDEDNWPTRWRQLAHQMKTAGPPDEDSWPTRWRQLAHQMKTAGPPDEDNWPTRWRQLAHQMKTTDYTDPTLLLYYSYGSKSC